MTPSSAARCRATAPREPRRRAAQTRFRLHPLHLAVCLLAAGGAARALPDGASVVQGQVAVKAATAPGSMLIVQTGDRATVDWRGFSIGAGEAVRISQPAATSVLLNRVTGGDPSLILGSLQADGTVFLVNPRGIVFGAGSRLDVGALVASTLEPSAAGLQRGRLDLAARDATAGAIVSAGIINAPGGTVVLAAPVITQSGSITAARVGLVAASAVTVDVEGDGLILFNARNDGLDARLDQLGRVRADGGSIELRAVARSGFVDTVLNLDGIVQARSIGQRDGRIVIDGGPHGITRVAAAADATGTAPGERGGTVQLTGDRVLVDAGASLDASGPAGGGRIAVGGGLHGADATLANASRVAVAAGARLAADATERGDGGRIVVWSQQSTRFAATASARGGARQGDGGLVEVSSKGLLALTGSADLSAPHGHAGTLLLDPADLTVQANNPDLNGDGSRGDDLTSPKIAFADDPGADSRITARALETQLATADVVLQATHDVNVTTPIASTSGRSLTLQAGNDVDVGASIRATGGIALSANDGGAGPASGSGRVVLGAALDAGSAAVTIGNAGSSLPNRLGADIAAGMLSIAGASTLAGSNTWTLSAASTVAAALDGSGALVKDGAGILTLSGASGYSGGTRVAAGTLKLGGASASAGTAGAAIVLDANAVLDIADGASVANAVTSRGGIVANSSGTGTLTGALTLAADGSRLASAAGAGGLTVAGAIGESGGARSLAKVDAGTVALAAGAANTYTGTTRLDAGTLVVDGTLRSAALDLRAGLLALGSAGRLLAVPAVTLAAGATLALGGDETVGSLAGAGSVALGAATLATGSAADATFSGVLSGSGGLTKQGSSTFVLAGDNRYGGTTRVAAGTLATIGDERIGDASALVVDAGATLRLGGSETAASLTGVGSVVTGGAGSLLSVGGGNAGSVFDGVVSGGGGLAKTGTGTLTLSGANSYSGGTRVVAGTLKLSGAPATAGAAAVAIDLDSDAVLDIADGASVANAVTSRGAVVTNSSGTGRLTGALTLAADGSRIGSAAGAGGLTVTGAIGESGGARALAKVDAGTVVLGAANTYSGPTQVAGGTLATLSSERIADASALVVDAGATLQLGGSETAASLAGAGSVVTSSAGSMLSVGGGNADSVFDGIVSGRGNLAKTGSGTLTLTGTNSHGGGTRVAAGTLKLSGAPATAGAAGAPVALDADAVLDIADGASVANAVTSRGGVVANSSGTGTLTGALTLAAGDSRVGSGAGRLTVAGAIGESGGARALAKVDAGTVVLAAGAANTYTGTTRLDAGTLVVDGTLRTAALDVRAGLLALGSAARLLATPVVTVAAGATLGLGGDETVGSLAGAGSVALGAATLATGGAADSTFSGMLSGSGGLTKQGISTFVLSGNNRYGGTTRVSAGTLATAGDERIGDASALVVDAGATLRLGGSETAASLAGAGSVVTAGAGSTLSVGGGNTSSVFDGIVSGSGGLTKTGSGMLTLAGTNSYGGTTRVAAGTLVTAGSERIADASALVVDAGAVLRLGGSETTASLTGAGSVVISSADSTLSVGGGNAGSTFNGIVSGSGGLAKTGSGTLTLTGANSHGGGTRVAAGTLKLSGAAAGAGAVGAPVVLDADAVLDIADDASIANAVTSRGAVITNSSGSGTLTGALTLAADGSRIGSAAGAGGLTVAGAIGESGGARALAKVDAGTVVLAASVANIYTGTTRLDAGTLRVDGTLRTAALDVRAGLLALGSAARLLATPVVTIASGATLGLGGDETVGSLAGAGSVALGAATLATGSAADSTFSGVLAGSGGLTKQGSSTFVLAGDNRYTGTTRVAAGTLATAGSERIADASALVVDAGATLQLGGSETAASLAGAGSVVTASAGSTLSVGGGNAGSTFDGIVSGSGGLAKTGSGTLTLAGDNSYGGVSSIEAGLLAVGGTLRSAALDVRGGMLALASGGRLLGVPGVAVARGATLALGGDETVGAVTLGGRLAGSATLSAASVALDGAAVAANLRTPTLASRGASRLDGSADASKLAVDAGSLTLGSGGRLAAGSVVTVAGGATLALGGSETIGSLAGAGGVALGNGTLATGGAGDSIFSGTLAGSGGLVKQGAASTFTLAGANSYGGSTTIAAGTLAVGDGGTAGTLGSGMVIADGLLRFQRSDAVTIANTIVGRGALVQAGSGVLTLAGTGNVYGGGTTVAAGTLATVGDARLPPTGDVAVAAGSRLALGGSEHIASLRADGEVSLGGSLAASGDLLLHGPVTVASAAPIGLTGNTVEAVSDGNRWGTQPLSIDASLLTLSSGRSAAGGDYLPLNLGSVTLAGGGSIDAGSLLIGSALALNGGTLTLTAHGMPSYALAGGSQSLAPQGQPLAFADDVIGQAAGSRVTSAAGAMLKLQAPAGASIGLTEDGNDLRGPLSALSGPAWNTPWAANWQNVGGTPAAAQGRVWLAGSQLLVGGQGIEADMVALRAGSVAMDGTVATITARLPYDNLLGTAVSVPGLTFELTGAAFATAFSYGRPDAEIRVAVGSAATGGRGSGGDAGLLTVLPRGGARGVTALYLIGPASGPGSGYRFFQQGARVASEIPVFYNGLLPLTPQLESSLSSVAAMLESARKDRFDEAVRTENVAVRLRAGIIAEVGPGRPATQGGETARPPETCRPADGTLQCDRDRAGETVRPASVPAGERPDAIPGSEPGRPATEAAAGAPAPAPCTPVEGSLRCERP